MKTAVELLEEKLKTIIPINLMNDVLIKDVIKQAKELEKQQKKDDYNQGYRDGLNDDGINSGGKDIAEFADAEQYYNETYKKD